jgi:arabinan endo-1,5-alpha-L-arabinosidase
MNAERTRTVGTVTEVAQGRRMEGGFVVRRDGFSYLFSSDAGCCDGAYSGYQVKVGRATSKGVVVVGAGGDGWIGTGHNSLQTDLSGQDWLVYHAIPADDPGLDPVPGIAEPPAKRTSHGGLGSQEMERCAPCLSPSSLPQLQ